MSKTFDLSIFDTATQAEKGFELEVLNVKGEASGLFITVLGFDSSTYQKLADRLARERARKAWKAKKGIDGAEFYDENKEAELDAVAACTIAWRVKSGEPMPFDVTDKEKVKDFYLRCRDVYDQVKAAIGDRANFIKG